MSTPASIQTPLSHRLTHVIATVKRQDWVEYECDHADIEQAVAAGLVERRPNPENDRFDIYAVTAKGEAALAAEDEVTRLRRRVMELEAKLDECEDHVANATGGYGP